MYYIFWIKYNIFGHDLCSLSLKYIFVYPGSMFVIHTMLFDLFIYFFFFTNFTLIHLSLSLFVSVSPTGAVRWSSLICGWDQCPWSAPRAAGKLLVCGGLHQLGFPRVSVAESKLVECVNVYILYICNVPSKMRHCSHADGRNNIWEKVRYFLNQS